MTGLALRILAIVVSTVPLAAQRTWIVDQNNGPGTDFTDMPPAVAAASPNDTILVRAGRYSATTIGKALTVLGAGTATQFSALAVARTPAGARVVARDFWLPRLSVLHAGGSVHLEGIATPRGLFDIVRIVVDSSAHVTFTDCDLWIPGTGSDVSIVDSEVFFVRCTLTGVFWSHRTIVTTRSRLHVQDSTVVGFGVRIDLNNAAVWPAIVAASSTIFVTAGSHVAGGRACIGGIGCPGVVRAPSITGSATVYLDLSATIQPPTGIVPTIRTIPAVATVGAARGSTQQVTTFGPVFAQAFLFVSLPARQPLILPPLVVWLDPATTIPVSSSQLLLRPWTHSVRIPLSLPPGLPLLWQSAVVTNTGAIHASEPAVGIVH